MKTNKNKPGEAQTMILLSHGTQLNGNIKASAAMRIDGEVEGDIISKDKLVLGINGVITGSIEAEEVVVGGAIYGSIKAQKCLLLQSTGKIEGDVQAKEIEVEKGGFFKGSCTMKEDSPTINMASKQA